MMNSNTHKLKPGIFWLDTRKKKYCEGGKTLEHTAQRGGGIYLFRDVQDSVGHNTEQLDLIRPV